MAKKTEAKTIDAKVDENGKVVETEEKKPGFFKRHWKGLAIGGAATAAVLVAFAKYSGDDDEDEEDDDLVDTDAKSEEATKAEEGSFED